jgi:hypothetical protein
MKKVILFACAIYLSITFTSAQTPKRVHINGPRAFRLVSLLVTGSSEIGKAVGNQHKSEIVIHDFSVVKSSTYKYDTDSAIYKLDVYAAQGKIGSATNSTAIYEATALWEFLSTLGITTDLGLEGAYLNIATVDCKIDATVDIKSSNRVQCDLSNPY